MKCSFCNSDYTPTLDYIGQISIKGKTARGEVGWRCKVCRDNNIAKNEAGTLELMQDMFAITGEKANG